MIGNILHDRYRIVDKLGFGSYSTAWLALDTKAQSYVAVKVGVARSSLPETAVLRALASPGHHAIPIILDQFELNGANAIHLHNILPKLPSTLDNLSIEQLYEEYGEPSTVSITRRDGKPFSSNVPPRAVIPLYLGKNAQEFSMHDTNILLSDFGEAYAPDHNPRRGENCHTPLAVRPPEARFEPHALLSHPADIWSLATAIWEVIGMKALFSCEFASADELVSQQIAALGPLPSNWWMKWQERSQFYHDDGGPMECRYVWPDIKTAFEEYVQRSRRKPGWGFGEEEVGAILELMRGMLVFRSKGRLTVEEVLQSEWMVKWALPELERSEQTK